MSQTELSKVLKDLPNRILNVPVEERKALINNVIDSLHSDDVNSATVKGLSKIIATTITRYIDDASKVLIVNLIANLMKFHHDLAIEHLLNVFKILVTKELPSAPVEKSSAPAIVVFKWTTVLIENCDFESNIIKTEKNRIFQYLMALLQIIMSVDNEVFYKSTEDILFNLWSKKVCKDEFCRALNKLEPSGATVISSIFLMKFEGNHSDTLHEKLLQDFVKGIICTKSKILPILIKKCRPILEKMSATQFENLLLNPLTRGILRNPELVLSTTAVLLSELNIDCSDFTVKIGKLLIPHLSSKDENARTESAEALKHLSKKCFKPAPIEELLTNIFSLLAGSEGKISIIEYRISLLSGVGNLSYNQVGNDDIEVLLIAVTNHFAKLLMTEVQEKAICFALETFSLWSIKYIGKLPKNISEIFLKGFEQKSTTAAVRLSYLQWLLHCVHNAQFAESDSILPKLLKTYEQAIQNTTQITALSEGLCASCLILKIEKSSTNSSLNGFFNTIFDTSKNPFFQLRFLSNASPETLSFVFIMVEKLITLYKEQLKGSLSVLYKTIVFCLKVNNEKINFFCRPLLRNILKDQDGMKYAKSLLEEMIVQFETDFNDSQSNTKEVTEHLVNIIEDICDIENVDVASAYNMAETLLILCHHPVIYQHENSFWERILNTKLNIEPKKFISLKESYIKEKFIDNFISSSVYKNILQTLVRIQPQIMPLIILKIKVVLENQNICNVTNEEFFIFKTPDGELYDKSFIPNSDTLYASNGLRRENKVYSYKEQLEELQLKREIDEKRRLEGKLKMPQLTPKQQEALKNQLEKEKQIRERLTIIRNEVSDVISIIEAVSSGSPTYFALHSSELLEFILKDLRSPLVAEMLCDLYYNLYKEYFKDDLIALGKKVAISSIRLREPMCDLKDEWAVENTSKEVIDTIIELHSFTETRSKVEAGDKYVSSPAFAYILEFLKLSFTKDYIRNEEYLLYGLHFIEFQSKIRFDDVSDILKNPSFLPISKMITLLLSFVESSHGRVQSQAMNALLGVAQLCSGESNCTEASDVEIEILLNALENSSETTRDAALRSLIIITPSIKRELENEVVKRMLERNVWLTKFDVYPPNQVLSDELWSSLSLSPPEIDEVLAFSTHQHLSIQKASAKSLVPLLQQSDCISHVIKSFISTYKEKLIKIPAKLDQFDREIEPAIDQWEARRGIAIGINEVAQFFKIEDVDHVIQFMVSQGLGDRDEIVHKEMLAAALSIVELHGKEANVRLFPVFEDFLDKAPKSETFDNIRQAVVILMGSLARHLDKDDARIEPIVRRLIAALTTPSQQVQEAVANCLPHLMPAIKDEAPALIKKLLHQLIKSDKYGERRGAAYGIAGIVKGLGILSLKQMDIMSKLTTYIQEKKNYKSREGALFAFEVLCTNLGRLFEPYIVHVLPHLLQCFGDSSVYVRQAADDTAKVVMGKLSAHGVKLVLPALLDALDEDSWRTKTASVELLGAMAFCAPKQLSSCLPNIVPKLIEVLGDSHTKVQEAGADALKMIGSVIKNPEIQAIVPTLLKALEDPSKNTSVCLQCLLETKFVHFIDAPSLALIMPVVQRAFMDRSTETRKMAAQIIGNMYSLTDQKDLTPYLPNIIPGLKTSLLDPVPEVRAVSARALGAMVRGIGEASFEDLLPWLMQTLTSESSSVDRSGAAQGLSEVVGGLGIEKLHKLMPEIISTSQRSDIAPHVKDGYIMMFIYMPAAFPNEFTPYIGQIITPILKALADENEFVRDTALKAGQRIVNMYAESAVTLLLPELEKGLFDENWRIRFSSVQLLGDLLYRISGVSGKMTTETANDDDNFGTEQSHTAIISFLGEERRNRVLSGLYMGRSDVSLMVRQAALHVWKVVVTNTPRTLREILPTLFSLLLGCLASTSYDKRQVAARTLGDLVRKLGERVLPEIIPILEKGLGSSHADQRQGVCIGLSEIMASTSKEMVLSFVNSLVPTVRKALTDPLPEVRQAAAKTFDSLHSTVGSKALDDILPSMLEGLSDEDPEVAENTLDGLRQVMAIKSRVVLPYLVPQLTVQPVNTKALSILVSVAGDAVTKFLPKILSALLQSLSEAQGTSNEQTEIEYCQTVILSVTDEAGIRIIMDVLISSALSDNIATRRSASSLLSAFCMHSPGDYSQYVPQLLRCLLRLLADNDRDILQRSWDALNAVVKSLDAAQQIAHVTDVRQALRFALSDLNGDELPGFCLPKGIAPLLPIFRETILNGLPDEKENAAQGLGEVISVTSAQALQPSVVHITGPLIRILGDRFNANVKAAVLETLATLLKKVGVMLKQFLPQLQTTFIKALFDQNRTVRMKAGFALSELAKIHSRVDPLFNEIHNGIKSVDDSATRETMLQAMRNLISAAGTKLSEPIKKQVVSTLLGLLAHSEDVTRNCAGGCLGVLIRYLSKEQVDEVLGSSLFGKDTDDFSLKHGQSVLLFVSLKESPEAIIMESYEAKIVQLMCTNVQSDKIQLACNGVRALAYFLQYHFTNNMSPPTQTVTAFTRAMNHNSNEVKQIVAKSCSHLAKYLSSENMPLATLKYLAPMLVNGTKEKNGYVRSNSELALIAILRLRENDSVYVKLSEILESGAKDSLTEVVNKVLRKAILLPTGKEEELDDTLLS